MSFDLGSFAGNVGGDLASSALGLIGQNSQNQFNASMASSEMGFQREMSNTAYQRSVADMKAAGLNPGSMFGSGGPASTPMGAMAAPAGNVLSNNQLSGAYSSAKALGMQQDRTTSDIGVNSAQKDLYGAQEDYLGSQKYGQELQNQYDESMLPWKKKFGPWLEGLKAVGLGLNAMGSAKGLVMPNIQMPMNVNSAPKRTIGIGSPELGGAASGGR